MRGGMEMSGRRASVCRGERESELKKRAACKVQSGHKRELQREFKREFKRGMSGPTSTPPRPRLTTIGPTSTVLQAIHVHPGATGQVLACKEHIRLAQHPVQHLHSHAWKVRATSCCILQEPWLPLTLVDLRAQLGHEHGA